VTESSPLTIPYPFRALGGHEAGPDYDKKEVEDVLRAAVETGSPSVVVLRLPVVYGNRDPRRRFGGWVDQLDSALTEPSPSGAGADRAKRVESELPCVDGASFRLTHAHVRDVAHAIVLAAEQHPAGYHVLNVGEAETPTMRERAAGIARVMGVEVGWREVEELPDALTLFGRQANDFVVSSTKLRAQLGFAEVTSERERYEDIVAWARKSRG
jgi:nucleoside-diphosphate-sugar epimerase